jgi:hypothetical protein
MKSSMNVNVWPLNPVSARSNGLFRRLKLCKSIFRLYVFVYGRSTAVCLALSFVSMRVRHRSKQIELLLAEAAPVAAIPASERRLTLANVVIAKMQA